MKKLLTILLAVCLLSSMTTAVFADLWIPEDYENENLIALTYTDGKCYALNAFLTYVAEAKLGMNDSEDFTFEEQCDFALKHLELNPGLYNDAVTGYTNDKGETFMAVSGAQFEQTVRDFFGINITADRCKGYSDGMIYVSAENFAAEKDIFASVSDCRLLSFSSYFVSFEVYQADDAADYLEISNAHLPRSELTLLGEVRCVIRYSGSREDTEFQVTDFRLDHERDFHNPVELPFGNENKPFDPKTVSQMETVVLSPTGTMIPNHDRLILTVVLFVVGLAVIALATILTVFRRKKEEGK